MRAIVTVLCCLVAVACADGGGDVGDPAATITIADFSFGEPATISAGESVLVTNDDGATHTWTSTGGAFDSGNLAPGDTFSVALDEPGEYPFFCQIHPSMTGSLTVTG